MNPADFQERAKFFFDRERVREALVVAQDGLSYFPENRDLLYLQGMCGQVLGDRTLVQTSRQTLAASAPEWAGTSHFLCLCALDDNRLDEAEHHARTTIQLSPSNGKGYYVLSVVFLRRHRLEKAISAARDGLAQNPNDILLLTMLQRLYHITGDSRRELEMERRAGEINPEHRLWHLHAGLRLLEDGQVMAGRSRLRTSLRIDPNVASSTLDRMSEEIVRSHWLYRNYYFLKEDWPLRVLAITVSLIFFTLGWLFWWPFFWLGWLTIAFVIAWAAYDATFFLCCRWIRRGIARGRL